MMHWMPFTCHVFIMATENFSSSSGNGMRHCPLSTSYICICILHARTEVGEATEGVFLLIDIVLSFLLYSIQDNERATVVATLLIYSLLSSLEPKIPRLHPQARPLSSRTVSLVTILIPRPREANKFTGF